MKLRELREAGGRAARGAVRELWRKLPITQRVRYRIQALFPAATNRFSAHQQPPPEYARPPARQRVAVLRADEPAIGYRPARAIAPLPSPRARIVAFYVDSDEDACAQTIRARPQFDGHAQPRLPAALGLEVAPAARLRRQVELAQRYGIGAFAFELGRGGAQLAAAYRADQALGLPYCLVWNNEAQDGGELIAQLATYLSDPRYLRVDGKAILIVAEPERLDRARAQISRWREAAKKLGLGELIVAARQTEACLDPLALGFDACLPQPSLAQALPPITARQALINPAYHGEVFDWRQLARRATLSPGAFAVVSAGYDDEPGRPGEGRVFAHASPRGYADWLQRSLVAAEKIDAPFGELIFVDAWNDWRHGAVLEPDVRLGHAYLEATRDALLAAERELAGQRRPEEQRPCVVVHAYYVELLDEIARALLAARLDWRVIVTTQADRADAVRARLAMLGLPAEVEVHENRGRDILPFLRVANRLLDEGVEVVLKLHTKHSGHRTDGDTWRAQLIGRLVEPARAARIKEAFARDPRLGCVAPEGHVLPLPVYWGWNEDNVRYLCVRMGIADPDVTRDRFAAGSMFWIRLAALRPLLDAHLGEWEFEAEGGYIDGTMAHAVERALSLAVKGAGYRTDTAAEVCGIPFDHDATYAFAEASHPSS